MCHQSSAHNGYTYFCFFTNSFSASLIPVQSHDYKNVGRYEEACSILAQLSARNSVFQTHWNGTITGTCWTGNNLEWSGRGLFAVLSRYDDGRQSEHPVCKQKFELGISGTCQTNLLSWVQSTPMKTTSNLTSAHVHSGYPSCLFDSAFQVTVLHTSLSVVCHFPRTAHKVRYDYS
jgi:hypothetical protein